MYVELENLCKSFDGKPVVNRLDLRLEKGKILCFLGASGCGKTTTLKMIGGFLSPDEGRIVIDGLDMAGLPPERRPVATVFQNYALFPHMTVLQNVVYGLKFQGIGKKQALERGLEYLSMVGLADCARRRVYEISGGQQQRAALARALIVHPKVLLLDEPLSNLDAGLRIRMREEIRDIRRKFGVTMIFVTHDQEEAMAIADEIAIMNEGRLIQAGAPEEVYRNPKDRFVMNFLGASSLMRTAAGEELYLRPEEICFDENGPLEGIIEKAEYMGFYCQYTVKAGRDTLVIRVLGDELRRPGEKVRLSIKARRSLPL